MAFGLAVASGQTQDSSGNGMLNGSYRFRHVAIQNVDQFNDPTEITASYGTIAFDGAGHYTITGMTVDNTVSNGTPQALNITATYAIGSNGSGYLTNPIFPTDFNALVYGAVAQGVFTGSSTESEGDGNIFNDIFVAIPAGPAPTNASFTTPYQTGVLDFPGANGSAIRNALFELIPNGKGALGAITLNGQAANLFTNPVTQTITGGAYNFNSDGSATLTIPLPAGTSSSNALFTGSKTMFQSADGNFILGWTATGFDIFFGVRALTVSGSNSLTTGLYFTAALEDSQAGNGTDSYYGGNSNTGDSSGDAVIHQRVNTPSGLSFDFGTDDQYTVNGDGSTPVDFNGYQYLFGDGGNAFVAIGTNGLFSLLVGMHAPAFSGPGVYLNPVGVANAASFQPVTASIAPGELILLYGTNLASATVVTPGANTFPTGLGGVSVTIDGVLCPIYYVSPGQLAVIVPYEVASNQTGLANIQVTNNGVASNVVQVYLTDAAPGSFSQNANGIGLAAARHAATGLEITPSNPAMPGEFISLYLTGLGTVTPTISDGVVGPSNPLSWSDVYNAGNLTVLFDDFNSGSTGNLGTVQFAGLTPTLGGLYQINVQVPIGVLGDGDNVYVEFVTDAADILQIQIPYGTTAVTAAARPGAGEKARAHAMRQRPAATRRARGAVADPRP